MNAVEKVLTDDGVAALRARIAACDRPAYIKDGELACLAVSDAFTAIAGLSDQNGDEAGKRKNDRADRERDEAERRCLVFGQPQRIILKSDSGERHVVGLSRMKRTDGTAIVVGLDCVVSLDEMLSKALEAEDGNAAAGTAAGTIGEAADNGQQKQAPRKPVMSEDCENSRSDLQNVIEAVSMGVVLVDRALKVELVNGPFFDLWRLPKRKDLVGHQFRALMDINRDNGIYDVAQDEWETYVASRLEEITSGYVAPRNFTRADGVSLIYSVTPLSDGKRMVCYYDITEMQESKARIDAINEELGRTVRLLDDATDAMAQGLLIYDRDNIVVTNRRFYEYLDVCEVDFGPGRPWFDFVEHCAARGDFGTPEEAGRALAYIRESADKGLFHQMERRGSRGRWLRIDGKPTPGGLTVVTYSDITEMKAREAELETLVGKAEASDRAKSEFLANMSHEIRTPMNGVLGMAELLSKTALDTRQKTYCDIIVKSGNALLTIINDILDFSKIEAGEISLDSETFDLRDAVEDVASLMTADAAEKDIELAVRIASDLPRGVIGDPGRFRQILINIVGNAVKFTEHGHVLVDVSGAPQTDGRHAVDIRIEDTGPGIPPDKLHKVFEKFSQVDGSSTRRHEGTGLGLAITSRLLGLMGGTIDVKSVVGEGSVFTVQLALPVDGDIRVAAPPGADIAGARILVVDDNAVNRDILMAQLSSWECDACAAVSGQEGLNVLKTARELGVGIDCVILDHHMPAMTGLDMAAVMRRTPGLTDMPIVLLTSVDVDPRAPEIVALQLAAWLTKPARENLLFDTLRTVLGEPAGGEVDGRPAGPEPDKAAAPVPQPPVREISSGTPIDGVESAPAQEVGAASRPAVSARQDMSLELWMDSEGLAESVAGIGAALSGDDDEDDDSAHMDRQMGRFAQSAGRAVMSGGGPAHLDILVAEDNEVNQIVFSQILDDLGVVYRIVGNGQLAVAAFERMPPRLILMDVSMPVMNGHQATRAIREREAAKGTRVPIIGVTAHALKGDREACMEAGMDDYLSKPDSPEMLEAKIRNWIDLDAVAADDAPSRY